MKQEQADRIKFLEEQINIQYGEIQILDNEPLVKGETFEEFCEKREPFNSIIRKYSRELRLLVEPTFKPVVDYGDVMTLKQFKSACRSTMFIDSDGHGYYVRGDQQSDICIYPSDVDHNSIRKDFDKVIWFNK